MSIKIGDIDLLMQGLNNEYEIIRLSKIIDIIIQRTGVQLTKDDINTIEKEALEKLQKKYPNSGIVFVNKESR